MIAASAGYGSALPPLLELLEELELLDELELPELLELLDELEELDELELELPVAAVTAGSLPPPPPQDPKDKAHNSVSIVIVIHLHISGSPSHPCATRNGPIAPPHGHPSTLGNAA